MTKRKALLPALIPALALTGCAPGGVASAPPPAFRALGTEPFWTIEARGTRLTYATPDRPARPVRGVVRSQRADGTLFEGELDGRLFLLTLRPADCSDGMSDRRYPYAVTLTVDGGERRGCAYRP